MTRLALLLALPACAAEVPAEPTWAEHVAPILAANCVRCHGAPAIGGAPPGFRLDRHDTIAGELEPIQGAAEMARWIAARVADGSMPPGAPLDGEQIETVVRWAAQGAPRGARADNHAPVIELREVASAPGALILDYEIRDDDGELVAGALLAGDAVADASLHAGRGRAVVATGAATAPIALRARLADPSTEVTVDLGAFAVTPGPGAIAIDAPRRLAILDDVTTVRFTAPVDGAAEVRARLAPAPDVVIATGVAVTAGVPVEVPWDTRDLPPGALWELAVTVGGAAATVDRLILSDATTDDTLATITPILTARCGLCHVPGQLGPPRRDLLYQRLVARADMPPAPHAAAITDDERARVGRWLLAGAPE